jgi:GNAT superfamily N-acetyltransferase
MISEGSENSRLPGYHAGVTRPAIRPMTAPDIPATTAAILADDFGDRRAWFEFATTHAACSPVVAELDGTIVGSGVGTANGPAGWIGAIWVAPEHRRAGLGRALTQAVIDALEAAGCRTLLLVATDEGRRLYERMGFTLETHYRILEAPGSQPTGAEPAGNLDPAIRPYRPADLDALVTLDRAATGEDRHHIIERFATPTSTRVLELEGAVRGFVIRAPWGGGASVAPASADALRIHEARRSASGPAGRVRVGIVEGNRSGLAAFKAAGYRGRWSAPRFIRGDALNWRPDWIWGQFNFALG